MGQVYYGAQAKSYAQNAAVVKLNSANQTPEYIRFETGKEISEMELKSYLQGTFKLSSEINWNLLTTIVDKNGDMHKRYRLEYKGYPIHEGMFVIHLSNHKIYSLNGYFPKNINPGNVVSISEATALQYALKYVKAKVYKWEVKSEEDFIKSENDDPKATWYPKGNIQLKRDANSNKYRFVWVFDIYAHDPMSRADYYIDAQNGAIIFVNDKIMHSDSLGSAATKFSGTKPITTDYHNGSFRLREVGRGNGVETYDMNQGTNYGNAVDFNDSDNYWNNVNAQKDEVAGDAHWGMEMTYDYYMSEHNRNSIDGNGFKLKGYVHYDNNYANAFWNGQYMTFGDGNSSWQPLVALDIVGHEITHGLTSNTCDLDYSNESGAMNEAYSDIFGTSIEFFGKPTTANWLIGEDIGSPLRSMSNPKSKGDPDTYHGTNYYLGTADNGGVHTNSGVLNHWFYLTAAGGQGINDNNDTFNVIGVGVDTAANIAFRTLTVYLVNTSNYADCRFYSIQSAMDLYGSCSPAVRATTSAFYAVGIGNDYIPGVSADFNTNITAFCAPPASVNFLNLSNNANQFYWDFGDGDTSNTLSPNHIYSAFGSYTVKLIAYGGSCGLDSIIKTEYISVDTANPCFVLMPPTGSITKTSCSGVLFDDGGTSNYSDNSNSTIVIAPLGAASIDLTFTDFHFEAGYDFLKIYDGPNTQSNLIGSFDGDNLPNGGTINSTTGYLTLVQTSDGAVNKAGFIANWHCVMPTTPPVTNFKVLDTLTCTGIVSFQDISSNGPLSWNWHFGDGDSSSAQNPTHQYMHNGYYNVTLNTANSLGSNTATQIAVVHVDMVHKPYAPSQSVCNSGIFTLTAAGSGGTLKWYDSPTSTNVLDTGAVFLTSNLSQSKTYYVEEEKQLPALSAGKATNAGGGGNLNYNQGLIFDVYKPIILHSVNVYSNGSGTRNVTLRNSNGTAIANKSISVVSGLNTVILDFSIQPGTDYTLEGKNLFRNNSGVSYPYVLSGFLSINKSTAGSNSLGYYYYFYDWKILMPACRSERAEVHAYVNSAAPIADFSYSNADPYISFSDNSQNPGAVSWDFGDGGVSTLSNPNHLYSQNGTYQVTMNVNNGCGTDSKTKTVTINLATGIQNVDKEKRMHIFPNPAQNIVNIDLGLIMNGGNLEIIDFTGKIVYSSIVDVNQTKFKINIRNFAAGFYLVKFSSENAIITKKLIIE